MSNRFVQKGIILQSVGGFYYVKTADGVLECRAKGVFRQQGISPTAGDYVSVEQGDTNVIFEVYPRSNSFVRPRVANVTRLFIVVSAVQPQPSTTVTDKLCAISCKKGITPVVLLTKTDIASAESFASIYEKAGIQVLDCSDGREDGTQALRELLEDGINVFIGNSGVGKSSLLNRIDPALCRRTDEISLALGRGKHTTRSVELLAYKGGWLVDTPGFSAVDIEKTERIKKEELAECFREFAPYINDCRFADCSHTCEEGCAVLQAIKRGDIPEQRHKNYCEFYEAARHLNDWE